MMPDARTSATSVRFESERVQTGGVKGSELGVHVSFPLIASVVPQPMSAPISEPNAAPTASASVMLRAKVNPRVAPVSPPTNAPADWARLVAPIAYMVAQPASAPLCPILKARSLWAREMNVLREISDAAKNVPPATTRYPAVAPAPLSAIAPANAGP